MNDKEYIEFLVQQKTDLRWRAYQCENMLRWARASIRKGKGDLSVIADEIDLFLQGKDFFDEKEQQVG